LIGFEIYDLIHYIVSYINGFRRGVPVIYPTDITLLFSARDAEMAGFILFNQYA